MASRQLKKAQYGNILTKKAPKRVQAMASVLAYLWGTTSMRSHLASYHKTEYSSLAGSSTMNKPELDSFFKTKGCSKQRASEITSLIAQMVCQGLIMNANYKLDNLLLQLDYSLMTTPTRIFDRLNQIFE